MTANLLADSPRRLVARRFGVAIQHSAAEGHLTIALREGADIAAKRL